MCLPKQTVISSSPLGPRPVVQVVSYVRVPDKWVSGNCAHPEGRLLITMQIGGEQHPSPSCCLELALRPELQKYTLS